MRSLQALLVSVALALAFLNWWVPGFRRYALIGELPELSTLMQRKEGAVEQTGVNE